MSSIALDLQLNTSSVESQIKQVSDQLDKLGSKPIDIDASGFKGATKSVNELSTAFSNAQGDAQRLFDQQKRALAQLIASGKQGSKEFNQLQDSLKESRAEAKRFQDAMKEVEGSLEQIGQAGESGGALDSLKEKFSGIAEQAASFTIGGLLQSGIESAIGSIGDFVEAGSEYNNALENLKVQTGTAGAEFDRLKESAETAFLNGVGESVAEATKSVAIARQTFGDAFSPDDIDEFLKTSQALSSLYDADVNETLLKSNGLVKSFGLNGQEAADVLAIAYKNGAGQANDLLDTLAEYSPLAKEAGISAQSFAAILSNSLSAGVFNTDFIGDAIKETGIRLKEGDIAKAFEEIATQVPKSSQVVLKNLQDLEKQAKSGAITSGDLLQFGTQEIEKAFQAGQISDIVRKQLQFAIAGTKAEDMGAEGFAASFGKSVGAELDATLQGSLENLNKAAGQFNALERIDRQFQLFISQVGQYGIATLNSFLNPILDTLPTILEGISTVASGVTAFVNQILTSPFAEWIVTVASSIQGAFVGAFEFAKTAVDSFFQGITSLSDLFSRYAEVITFVVGVIIAYNAAAIAATVQTGLLAAQQVIASTATAALAAAQTGLNLVIGAGRALVSAAVAAYALMSSGQVLAAAKTAILTGAQWLLNAALSANPIGLIVAALAALTAGLVYAYKNSETFRNIIDSAWESIKGFVSGIGSAIKAVLQFFGILGSEQAADPGKAAQDRVDAEKEAAKKIADEQKKAEEEKKKREEAAAALALENEKKAAEERRKKAAEAAKKAAEEKKKQQEEAAKAEAELAKMTEERRISSIENQAQREIQLRTKTYNETLAKIAELEKKSNVEATELRKLELDRFNSDVERISLDAKVKQLEKEESLILVKDQETFDKRLALNVQLEALRRKAVEEEVKNLDPDSRAAALAEFDKKVEEKRAALNQDLQQKLAVQTSGSQEELAFRTRMSELDRQQAEELKKFEGNEALQLEIKRKYADLKRDTALERAKEENEGISLLSGFATAIVNQSIDQNLSASERFQQAVGAGFTALSQQTLNSLRESADGYKSVMLDQTATDEERKAALEELGTATVANVGAALGAAIANGENAGKALAKAAFDTLQSLIPVISAQILGFSLATPQSGLTGGTAGFAQWAALTAALQAAVAIARATLGFEKGVIGFDGKGTMDLGPGFGYDRYLVRLGEGESVMKKDVTQRNWGLLQHLQKGGDAQEWFRTHQRQTQSQSMSQSNQDISGIVYPIVRRLESLERTTMAAAKQYQMNTHSRVEVVPVPDPSGIFKSMKSQQRQRAMGY